MITLRLALLMSLTVGLAGCPAPLPSETAPSNRDVRPGAQGVPSEYTRAVLKEAAGLVEGFDPEDIAEARRGMIAEAGQALTTGDRDDVIWDRGAYDFLEGEAPPTVHPSLWHQSKLVKIAGLFEVTEGVYQVRGFDLANLTLIRGETGWIVIDPLMSEETARTAYTFAMTHLKDPAPLSALLYTHSHMDHFGGVMGVMGASRAAGPGNNVPVYAPKGFMHEATKENMLAGTAMGRRSVLMYGRPLERGPLGHIGAGLGLAPAFGTVSIVPPTQTIGEGKGGLDERVIDGVTFVFKDVSGSEAPSEFAFYLPEKKAFGGSELVSRTLHNVYTLRGAQVRDALRWSDLIDEALLEFPETEIYFGGHLWPMWGKERITDFMESQRDMYRYIHDQTLRLANAGYTPKEIAEELELLPKVAQRGHNRPYYGTVSHNVKAVYQGYFGWYDGNPAHLNPLPEVEAGKRYVEMMGGADELLQKAQSYYDKGEYRWVAEVLNHLVFAEPNNEAAAEMLASSYEQLGFQSESAIWRDSYLTGAAELRHGDIIAGVDMSRVTGLLKETPLPLFLDALAVRLKGEEAGEADLAVALAFEDLGVTYLLSINNGVLHHRELQDTDGTPQASIKMTFALFLRLLSKEVGAMEMLRTDDLKVEGSKVDLLRFFSLFEVPKEGFEIVRP